ncbi:hypothetical protein BJP25_04715 [Actinokineospora bangkokensis]|uniref:Uncharacterized protein n=1 Tax=Actinokineospora bangkokensis TaxID=1193682 RepID=A0A1Q9LCB8_9PSEU|nr:hypothetical protein BJP25_04715 [Actinokineospora bangkokensis]
MQAASVRDVHFHPAAREVVPRELPPDPGGFVGRDAELAALDAALDAVAGTSAPIVVTGVPGLGKTALAVHWLHRVGAGFDDGQLVARLRDPDTGEPRTPAAVLGGFLLSLGVEPDRVPLERERCEVLYRSMTADRRLVVLLDDAVSAAQVRPLLPAAGLVVVTSRARLSGLAVVGARWVDPGPVAGADALRLFDAVVGAERVAAEPGAALAAAELCGGLPLALGVVAARLAGRAHRTFATEVGELRGEAGRVDRLALRGGESVGVVLDVAASALDERTARVHRACAWHPGREFGAAVVAAGVDEPVADVLDAVDELVEANLVAEVADGRFGMHDLVRLHARGWAGDGGRRVRERMVEWYLDRVVAVDLVVHPRRPRLGPRYGRVEPAACTPAAALAWVAVERESITAAVAAAVELGRDDLVWQFCEALWGDFLHSRRYAEWIDLQHAGVAAAQRLGDRRAEALVRVQLGYACAKLGRRAEAVEHDTAAVDLARAAGDAAAEASALEQLGVAVVDDDPEAAAAHYRRARDLNVGLGRVRGVALCDRRIAEVLLRRGRFDDAARLLGSVAATMRDLGDPTQHARAVMRTAEAHVLAGAPGRALDVLRAALAEMAEFGSPHYQAEILERMGEVAARTGDVDGAARHWAGAAGFFEATGDRAAVERVTALAAALAPQADHPGR